MTTIPTPDPLTALAAELGRIGQRLDGMGVELMTLRDGMGAAAAASPPEGRTVALRGEEAATSGHGGPARGGAPVAGGGDLSAAANGAPSPVWPAEASSAGSAGPLPSWPAGAAAPPSPPAGPPASWAAPTAGFAGSWAAPPPGAAASSPWSPPAP